MTRGIKLTLGALLLSALALVGWKLLLVADGPAHHSSSDQSAAASHAPVMKNSDLASSHGIEQPALPGPGAAPSARTRITMPSADMPAAEVIARLDSAARSGSVSASCRIAIELQDCANRKNQLAAADAVEKSIQSTGASSRQLENITGGLLAASDRLEAKCLGITDQQLSAAFMYQMTAARGDPDLARWLVANPVLDRSVFMDQLEEWQRYKEFADHFLTAAVGQPSAENLPLLLSAYKPRSHPNIEILHREDSAMFLALVDIAQAGGASLPNDILESAYGIRNNPGVVEAASRQRIALEEAGWGSAALERSDFMPGPLRKPSIEQCEQTR